MISQGCRPSEGPWDQKLTRLDGFKSLVTAEEVDLIYVHSYMMLDIHSYSS